MSPSNINSFVGDLVQMAQAVEQLPKVEAERDSFSSQLENALERVQDRELAIIGYKEQIEALNAKVRSLEVERDDASFRVMEAEDREHVALNMARNVASAVGNIVSTLDPPKPEPVKEPEPSKLDDGGPYNESQGHSETPSTSSTETQGQSEAGSTNASSVPEAVHSIHEAGQSEEHPTAKEESTSLETASSHSANTTDAASTDGSTKHGPYFGKRYHDVPTYIPLADWLAGGGTEEDYYWRPVRSSH